MARRNSSRRLYDENGNEVKVKKRGGCLKSLGIIIIIFFGLGIIGNMLGEDSTTSSQPVSNTQETSAILNDNEDGDSIVVESLESNIENDVPREHKNALRQAENYLNTMPFSESGLAEQLEFEEYPQDAIDYAMDNINPDWNDNALRQAQNYLDTMPFSDSDLYDQLIFEGYSDSQAQHAINNLD